MNIKIAWSFFAFLVVSLTGCNMTSSNNNTSFSHSSESGTANGELVFVPEEEQLKNSDLVCRVAVVQKGEVEFIDNQPFTVYYFKILEVIKGEETTDHAYFRGDTTENSSVTSSIDERSIENENINYIYEEETTSM